MAFAEIEAAWQAGNTVQYLVVIGYDDEWTDYTGKTKPQEQSGRLVWRVKPASIGDPQGNAGLSGDSEANKEKG